jgi:anti-anti-sigma regulatory factor
VDIQLEPAQGRVPVTVLRVHGDIDRSNYEALVQHIQDAYQAGTRDVLLDLREVGYMSSAGLVAMQGIIKILRGDAPPNPEDGWGALHSLDKLRDGTKQQHFKLLSPQPAVAKSLDMVGFTDFIDVYDDEATAVASF